MNNNEYYDRNRDVIVQHPEFQFGTRYIVSRSGIIYDTKTNTNVPLYYSTTNMIFCALCDISDTTHIVRHDVIVSVSFNPSSLYYINDTKAIKVIHDNGNSSSDFSFNLSLVDDIEEWRPIDDIDVKPNMYEISSFGRIRSAKHGMMSLCNHNGYKQIHLRGTNKEFVNKRVHRLVAKAFIPNDSEDRVFINHIDGDRSNNYWWNLEWVTRSENAKHAIFFGLEIPLVGSANGSALIDEEAASHIWGLLLDDPVKLRKRQKTNGSPTKVVRYCKEDGFENVNINIVTNIKSMASWRAMIDENVNFQKLNTKLSESIVKHIWMLLIDDDAALNNRPKTNASPTVVKEYLDEDGMGEKCNLLMISAIKHKRSWSEITDLLPQKVFSDLRIKNPNNKQSA